MIGQNGNESFPARESEVLLVDFDAGEHGHRGQYNAMLARLFRVRRARFSLAMLLAREPVLIPQIEASPAGFFLTILVRGLLGRRTVGFLLRPLPALQGRSARLRLKRLTLRIVRHFPGARVLTIIPFAIEPGLAGVAHGWIHDLQNWDLQLEDAQIGASGGDLTAAIGAAAQGRRVCCAIGRQDKGKGFDRFAGLFIDNPGLRETMLFAFGGKVAPGLGETARGFVASGGFALDRFVSDAELFELYAAADLVWCIYDPQYDQASGVLGRAMQLGLPVVARPGSVIAAICANEGHPCIAADDTNLAGELGRLPEPIDLEAARRRARLHGETSLTRLARALGVRPAWNPFAQRGDKD